MFEWTEESSPDVGLCPPQSELLCSKCGSHNIKINRADATVWPSVVKVTARTVESCTDAQVESGGRFVFKCYNCTSIMELLVEKVGNTFNVRWGRK